MKLADSANCESGFWLFTLNCHNNALDTDGLSLPGFFNRPISVAVETKFFELSKTVSRGNCWRIFWTMLLEHG